MLFATTNSAIKGGRDLDTLLLPALSLTPRASVRAFLGTVQDRDQAIFAGGFESIAFIGVVVALLVADRCRPVGGLPDGSRPWAITLATAALLALTWAIGPRTAIYRLAYEIVPGFDLARRRRAAVVIVVLVAALFAGVGVDVIWRGPATLAWLRAIVAITAVMRPRRARCGRHRRSAVGQYLGGDIAAVAIALLIANAAVRSSRVARGAAVTILVLAGLELAAMSVHSIPQRLETNTTFTSHRTATTEYLREQGAGLVLALTDDGATVEYEVPGMRPNANVLAGVPSIDGYDGGVQITERSAKHAPTVPIGSSHRAAAPQQPDPAHRTRPARPTRRSLHPVGQQAPAGRLHPRLGGAAGE